MEQTDSLESIVNKGWGVISPNTEILVFMFLGVLGTIAELVGLWPEMRLTELFPVELQREIHPKLKNFTFAISDSVNVIRLYSVHLYLATYILLPYPLLTEKQKVLLVPWLLCGVLRSVLLNLLTSLMGILLCSSYHKLNYPCLEYSVLHGMELCISIFLWTTVHNFYYFLESRPISDLEQVIKSIKKSGKRSILSNDSSQSEDKIDYNDEDEEWTPGSEVDLVGRAAMAWIAREILESGGEYINDRQFSQFLALKATMELRQITKELAELKPEKRRKRATTTEKVRESLEFCRKTAMRHTVSSPLASRSISEAFQMAPQLSKRTSTRKSKPLVNIEKPLVDDDDSLDKFLEEINNNHNSLTDMRGSDTPEEENAESVPIHPDQTFMDEENVEQTIVETTKENNKE
ncbi:uncharacterized protein LOC124363889 [Homalodisca vitripennis]|uniref:uncharacterized protein LOC124363889 n=1 Tax=Homalodisca vitripennis TaxID=197043 RepID=UPI001EE9EF8E|nr:uncharacterized protein LOC124363889 [Homalodisca vitripennis]